MESSNYAQHLSEVNNSKRVHASSDIKNDQGQLVVPKGRAIDAATTKQILKFKLLKPLEESIQIEGNFGGSDLFGVIECFFESDSSLVQIWKNEQAGDELLECCNHLCSFPILRQKLTVLQIQFPEVFDQAMFNAWFVSVLYKKAEAPQSLIKDAFIAAIMCDIGILHLPPEVIHKGSERNTEEERQYRAHPLISGEILRHTKGIPKAIFRAVEEHHERIDASGYPKNKISKQISALGLTLGLIDDCHGMYFGNLKNKTGNFSDIAPLIQINPHYRTNADAAALLMMVKHIVPRQECFTPDRYFSDFIRFVEKKHSFVFKFLKIATEFNTNVGYTHEQKKLLGMQNILLHICLSVNQSGLINEAYFRWLQQVRKDKLQFAYREVEDVSLMLDEVIHHCERFIESLNLITTESNGSNELSSVLKHACDQFSELNEIKTQPAGMLEEYFI